MNPLRGEQKGPGRCPGAVLCFNMRVASDQRVCLRVGPRLHGRNPPPRLRAAKRCVGQGALAGASNLDF